MALGKVYDEQGAYDRAIPLLEQATHLYTTPGKDDRTRRGDGQLANAHYYAGHLDTADALNRRALDIDRALHGDRHPSVADDLINLGASAFDRGRYREAEGYRRRAWTSSRPGMATTIRKPRPR